MGNDVSVTIDVANQSITSSDTNIITVPTQNQNFELVTFDNKPCIRATSSTYATFTISPTIKSLSCDVFLQAVDGFTLFIEFNTVLNTKYSLVYYPHGEWWNPDSTVFDNNNVLVGVWVTVTYSSSNKTITFDNGTNQLVRTIDSSIVDLNIGNFEGRYNIYLTNLGAEISSRYVNKPGVAEIWANTKNYIAAQLLGKSNVGHTHSASDITSGLASVATSGSYSDLTNKPSIPSKTSDLTNDSGFITSVDWSDVNNKPNIPTVNNATLTIQQNGATVQTFTANQSTNVTADIAVPTKTSQLTNDSGYITSSGSCNYANSAGAVAWDNVSGKPSTFTPSSHTHNYAGSSNAGGAASSTLKLETYKQGSTTETYGANYPIFAQWVDNNNVALKCTNYTVWVDKANSVAWGNVSGRPTALSQFTNDSGFITSADCLPIGSYIQFAGSQAPAGFLVCNGGAISRTTYSALFAVIGTTYGSGDGSTTFNLPNLTDRFLQGSTTSGTVKNAGLPNINGSLDTGKNGTGFSLDSSRVTAKGAMSVTGDNNGCTIATGHSTYRILGFKASRSSSIYGNSNTVQPPALTCLICIKY